MPRLSYNDEKHEYDLDSIVIPSVTQIAQAVTGKDLSKIPPKILQAARARGVEIHADVEEGTLKTREAQWINEQLSREACQFEVMGYATIGDFSYAGRTDIIEGEYRIYDIKSQSSDDLLYWTIQLNLYRLMYQGIQSLKVLHVPNSGNYKVIDIQVLPDEKINEIIEAFKSGKTLDDSFLSNSVEHEEVSLDLIVYEKNIGTLTTNAQAILEAVNRKLESYKPENYTEENIAEAKKDKAALNNSAKLLNEKRIEIEREFNKPLDPFKETVNKAVAAIKTASSRIDVLVKEVENQEKAKKKDLLIAYFNKLRCELVTFDQIFQDRWLNKTVKVKEAEGEILAAVEKIDSDLVILDRIGEPEARKHYLVTLNLDSALAKADEIKQAEERLRKAQEVQPEPQVVQDEPQFSSPVQSVVSVGSPASFSFDRAVNQAPQPSQETTTLVADEEVLRRAFEVFGTKDQLVGLSEYMNVNGIKFSLL